MDLPDLLSRCLSAPKSARKMADLIDATDFEYNPLASLVPEYFTYMHIYYGGNEGGTDPAEMNFSMADIEYNESYDNPQSIWKPHEKAIMSVLSVLPVTSSVFCQSDYFACPDFCQRYCDINHGARYEEISRRSRRTLRLTAPGAGLGSGACYVAARFSPRRPRTGSSLTWLWYTRGKGWRARALAATAR